MTHWDEGVAAKEYFIPLVTPPMNPSGSLQHSTSIMIRGSTCRRKCEDPSTYSIINFLGIPRNKKRLTLKFYFKVFFKNGILSYLYFQRNFKLATCMVDSR